MGEDWTAAQRARWLMEQWAMQPDAVRQASLDAMIRRDQEQQQRIAALEAENAALRAQVERLQAWGAWWQGCADAYYVDRAETLGCPPLRPGDLDPLPD